MPNDRRLLRAAVGGPPSYPGYGGYAGGSRLIDLIMFGGQQQAEAAREQGQMWGDTIAGVGQQIGAGLEKHAQQKAMAKRDAAWVSFVNGGEWAQDPKIALSKSIEIWGPQEGPKQFQALAATSQLMQPKRNPEADQKALAMVGGAMSKMGEPARATLWPQVVRLTKGVMPDVQLPEQYDPKVWAEVVEPFVAQMQGPRKLESVSPGASLVDPQTGEAVFTAPKPPAEKRIQTVETAEGIRTFDPQTGEMGPVIARGKPNAPRDERLVQIMGPAGTPVWVKESQAVGKPAAQAARAVTGAERQSLAYYNRAKTASDDIAPIEEKVAGSGLGRSLQLQYGGNLLQTKEQQQYRQAQRAFTEARLRKESGAAIPTHEYENDAKTYFAQPGDSPEVLAQKRAAREEVLRGLGYSSGRAYEEFYGVPLETPRNRGSAPRAPAGGSKFEILKVE